MLSYDPFGMHHCDGDGDGHSTMPMMDDIIALSLLVSLLLLIQETSAAEENDSKGRKAGHAISNC